MQSLARSLTLTASLTLAAIVALLLMAAPQENTSIGAMKLASPPPPAQRTNEPAPPAPISFSDPDGQELILEELSVRTAIHGMLSLTEMELRFRNPQSHTIEGRFSCTLPPNAAISRFAKEVNGRLMEGEVVERLRANQVYEQFLHQMRDPALLEQDQGNRFSARIFPIGPNEPVRLLLSYTALLPLRDGQRTYTLPLRGMAKVHKLTFRAFVTPIPAASTNGQLTSTTAEVTRFDQENWTPDRDIVLTSRESGTGPMVLRAGDFYLAALRPEVTLERRQASSSWLFYVDTSASSAEGAQHRIRALEEVFAALPPSDDVQVVAFDHDVVPLARGSAAQLSRTIGNSLQHRLFLGGTDLGVLLSDVAQRSAKEPSRTIVVASDLVATLGNTAAHEVQSAIAKLPAQARVHALILGSREDAPTARQLTMGRGRVVRIAFTDALASRAAAAAAELRRPLGGSVDVADRGAEWIHPTHFDDVAPGDEVLVLGKVRAGEEPRIASTAAVRLESATFAPLLEREAYRAYLDYLAAREATESSEAVRRALAAEQVKISIEQRVVIPRTTMLVLESESDYQRFGLDRRALGKILTIDAGGIGRLDRPQVPWGPPVVQTQKRIAAPSSAPPPATMAARAQQPPPVDVMPRPETEERSDVVAPNEVQAEPEGAVFGGVEGGVVGSVPGGVAGGMIGGSVAAAPARDRISVTADSPVVEQDANAARRRIDVPRPAPPPPALVPAPQPKQESAWIRQQTPSRARIDELEAALQRDPRDRESYNQLSEALAVHGEWAALRSVALRWQPYDPENPQVYEVLGIAADSLGNDAEAARAFASLIEIAPAKTELLQRAGLLLLRTRSARLAETPLRKALEVRPDRANGYRHLALMLWREGRFEEAARVLESATRQTFPNWYGNVQRVIREELGSVYRAWSRSDPSRSSEIAERAREHSVDLSRRDALRVTLAWETDANDVDLHVVDPAGEECFYRNKSTRAGLTLYEDITQGLGPEVVRTGKLDRGTYHVGVRYFAAGPMGISRGLVIVLRDDDQLEIHPFRLTKGGGDIRYVTGVVVK